mgnify:CR=1 FL=1
MKAPNNSTVCMESVPLTPADADYKSPGCDAVPQRHSRYEISPQRGGARMRVRYREGSYSTDKDADCPLCRG